MNRSTHLTRSLKKLIALTFFNAMRQSNDYSVVVHNQRLSDLSEACRLGIGISETPKGLAVSLT